MNIHTSEPIPVTTERGAHLMAAITKATQDRLTVQKAAQLRDECDNELDLLAKAHSEQHGVGYYDAYAHVTRDGVGKSLMETSMQLSSIIAAPARQE